MTTRDRTPAPSPNGTNKARLFLGGSAAKAVRQGRALLGAAYDSRFGMARDQTEYEPPEDEIAKALGELSVYLQPYVSAQNYPHVQAKISEIRRLSTARVKDHNTALNAAANKNFSDNATDDDLPADKIDAYPPKETKGSLTMDSRKPSWAGGRRAAKTIGEEGFLKRCPSARRIGFA